MNAQPLLSSDVETPSDSALAAQQQLQADQLRKLISHSLTPEIIAKLPPGILRESPYQICAILQEQIHMSSLETHEALDAEARSIQLLGGDNFNKYLDNHMAVRHKMMLAGYPNISQERTTVQYLIRGLTNHPDLATLSLFLIGNPPTSINAFTNHIREVLLVQQSSSRQTPSNKGVTTFPSYKSSRAPHKRNTPSYQPSTSTRNATEARHYNPP